MGAFQMLVARDPHIQFKRVTNGKDARTGYSVPHLQRSGKVLGYRARREYFEVCEVRGL